MNTDWFGLISSVVLFVMLYLVLKRMFPWIKGENIIVNARTLEPLLSDLQPIRSAEVVRGIYQGRQVTLKSRLYTGDFLTGRLGEHSFAALTIRPNIKKSFPLHFFGKKVTENTSFYPGYHEIGIGDGLSFLKKQLTREEIQAMLNELVSACEILEAQAASAGQTRTG